MTTDVKKKPSYLVQTTTNFIFAYNPYLAKRADMIPIFEKNPPTKKEDGHVLYDGATKSGGKFEIIGDEVAVEVVKTLEDEHEKSTEDREKLLADIVATIPTLKVVDYTSAGLPKVDKLSSVLGVPVSSHDRDEAWGIYLEMKALTEE